MNILHLVASLRGGAGYHAVQLCEGLWQQGDNVWLAAPEDNPSIEPLLARVSQLFVPMPLGQGGSLAALLELKNLVVQKKIKIIHAHGLRAAWYGRALKLYCGLRVRLVVTYHGYHIPFYRPWTAKIGYSVMETLARRCLSDCSIFVSNSDLGLCYGAEVPTPPHSFLIHNGIDVNALAATPAKQDCRQALGWATEQLIVGTVSRLHKQKNIELLLRSWALFKHHYRTHPDYSEQITHARLWVVGDGPQSHYLHSVADQLEITDSVVFAGERSDVRTMIRAWDSFLLTSLWEGCPLVILEAFALKTPVIATRSVGITELVRHQHTGVLADPHPADIAAQILFRVKDPQLVEPWTHNAFQFVVENYQFEKMVNDLKKVYSEYSVEYPG